MTWSEFNTKILIINLFGCLIKHHVYFIAGNLFFWNGAFNQRSSHHILLIAKEEEELVSFQLFGSAILWRFLICLFQLLTLFFFNPLSFLFLFESLDRRKTNIPKTLEYHQDGLNALNLHAIKYKSSLCATHPHCLSRYYHYSPTYTNSKVFVVWHCVVLLSLDFYACLFRDYAGLIISINPPPFVGWLGRSYKKMLLLPLSLCPVVLHNDR